MNSPDLGSPLSVYPIRNVRGILVECGKISMDCL